MEAKRRIHRDIEEIPDDHSETFWSWWEKWGLKILTVLAVVLAIIAVVRWVQATRAAAHERAWGDLAGATSPETLRAVAEGNAGNAPVVALAQLRAGDLLLGRAIAPEAAQPAASQPSIRPAKSPEAERTADLKGAEDAYNAVIATPGASPVIQFNARLGLASVAEMRGQWDKAREIYQAVAKDAGDNYAAIRQQAVTREGLLDRLPAALAFSPEAPATQPDAAFPMPHIGIGGATTQPAKP